MFAFSLFIDFCVIRLITDPMEIYYHLIQAQFVHLHYTKGSVSKL